VSNVLVLTGGPDYAHDFVSLGTALQNLFESDGHQVTVVHHPDDAAALLPGSFDVLLINALRWQMLHERYDQMRAEWGYSTPESTKQAITSFVQAGGGLVGNHTASICFDDWPEWGTVLGGAWNWGRSSHPPLGPVAAHVVPGSAASHPVLAGVPATLELVDEVYGDMDLQPATEVLMTARRTPDDREQPVVWVAQYGEGRVVYDGFGHDVTSVTQADHARLLRNAVRWATGTNA